jgi:hypothetical protein
MLKWARRAKPAVGWIAAPQEDITDDGHETLRDAGTVELREIDPLNLVNAIHS